jgi:recombination protein RecR
MGPLPLEDLITAFSRLPGIGRKTAQRLAFHVIKRPREEAEKLSRALVEAKDNIQYCSECYNYTERGSDRCEVCRDPRRDQTTICVVEDASDVLTLEHNQLYRGIYHVLGGALSPLDGIRPDDLRIDELVERIKGNRVEEVIIGLNPSAEGEATAEYLLQQIGTSTRVTRLARGLPVGSDLDLADRITLAHALEGRHAF